MKNCFTYFKDLWKKLAWLWQATIAAALAFVVIVFDYYNVISVCVSVIPTIILVGIIIVISIAIIAWFISNNYFDLFRLYTMNAMDIAASIALLTSIPCLCYWCFNEKLCSYKVIVSFIVVITSLAIIIVRVAKCYHIQKDSQEKTCQLLDLADIYRNDFSITKGVPLLIDETSATYDMLGRSSVINQLILSIYHSQSAHAFSIGLEGPWGSGKSTILNIVKKEIKQEYSKKISIIDDFDPWVLGSQEAIMLSLFDCLLHNTGIEYSISRSKRIARSLKSTISSVSASANVLWSVVDYEKNDYEQIMEVKDQLSLYLQKSPKHFVVIIDNIDRASGDNILFLLKLIATYFDLPNITYVLAYDRKRLEKVLVDEGKIEPRYLDKIIQVSIPVPEISLVRIASIYGRCLENLLAKAGVSLDDLKEYRTLLNVLTETVTDLRTLKRLLNSSFNTAFLNDSQLSRSELFSLEVIHFLDPQLYGEIFQNRKFFISHDKMFDRNVYINCFDKEAFNKEGHDFYSKLKEKHPSCFPILTALFPYAMRFEHGQKLEMNYVSDGSYQELAKRLPICSAKYFDLYFSYTTNEYLAIGTDVKEFIEKVNNRKNVSDVYSLTAETIKQLTPQTQKEWFELFDLHLSDISSSCLYQIALAILDNITSIDNSSTFLALNAFSRAEVIVERILELVSDEDFHSFTILLSDSYDKLCFVSNILYWFDNAKENTLLVQDRRGIIKHIYDTACKNIINRKINLYDDAVYSRHNIWGLTRYIKKVPEEKDAFDEYMMAIISEENVYRILGDALCQSIGNGYGYSISTESISALGLSESAIDEILFKRKPSSESEVFVSQVYDKYKSGEKDEWGRCQVITQEEVKIDL